MYLIFKSVFSWDGFLARVQASLVGIFGSNAKYLFACPKCGGTMQISVRDFAIRLVLGLPGVLFLLPLWGTVMSRLFAPNSLESNAMMRILKTGGFLGFFSLSLTLVLYFSLPITKWEQSKNP